jgi:hypothetical protein
LAEKLCIYCHKVTLNGFDETERKYYEKGSKTLHTRERCEAAKRGELDTSTKEKSGVIINNQDFKQLVTKVDALIEMVNELNHRLSGQGTLEIEP